MSAINKPPLILIVDDDPGICRMLVRYLEDQGLKSESVGSAIEMDAWLEINSANLIVLDLMLPGEDGLSIARRLRAGSNIPIIMLTAKGDEIDRIIGLEVGADDYLAKPFNPRELLARIHSLLRRANYQNVDDSSDEVVFFGEFQFNKKSLILTRSGKEIELGYSDIGLLQLFIEKPNQPLSRDFILNQLSGIDRDPFDRSVDVRVTRLRKKIESDPASPQFIRTARGIGYRFTPKGGSE
ncbi:MAG TPA: response regulator [Candidatus Thioglobus sp.]|jgi:DNA-binding response OmpR family regulator|nr:response regulator [Candidatus Thioglobus sp.]